MAETTKLAPKWGTCGDYGHWCDCLPFGIVKQSSGLKAEVHIRILSTI